MFDNFESDSAVVALSVSKPVEEEVLSTSVEVPPMIEMAAAVGTAIGRIVCKEETKLLATGRT
jgi:hypothetical protein